jgi:heptaprenyl diphosphate synthase
MRVLLVGILRTGLFSITFFFSLSGAIFSLAFMYLFIKISKLSVVGISIIGAIFHSIGQILIATIFLSNINILYYLPILLISSVITGIIVGYTSDKIINNS